MKESSNSLHFLYIEAVLEEKFRSPRKAIEMFEDLIEKISQPTTNFEKALLRDALNSLSIARLRFDETVLAQPTAERSLLLAEEIGALSNVGSVCGTMGNIYRRLGKYDLAKEYKARAIRMAKIVDNYNLLAMSVGDIGIIELEQENYNAASEAFWHSLTIAIKHNLLLVVADQFGNLGTLCIPPAGMNFPLAVKFFEQSLEFDKLNGRWRTIAATNLNLARIFAIIGDEEKSATYATDAIPLFEKIGDQQSAAYARTLCKAK
jgi:tetratricopeptide (TPR) repeat protein